MVTVRLLLATLLFQVSLNAQPAAAPTTKDFASWSKTSLVLDNGVVRRELSLGQQGSSVSTRSYTLTGEKDSFLKANSPEFSLEVDGKRLTGSKDFTVTACRAASDARGGRGAVLSLATAPGSKPALEVELSWLLYPGLPVIRKQLALRNTGGETLSIEALDTEALTLAWGDTNVWTLGNYARDQNLGRFKGNWNDCAVVVHNITDKLGIVLGNEAPGVVKRTSVFLDGRSATIGLTRKGDDYPFRKWLKPAERWESPACFTALYRDTLDPMAALNGPVNDYVRRHMGIRLALNPEKPGFVYNTWVPFRTKIDDALMREVADAAANCGAKEFVIDDGWQSSYGDWTIDAKKFPQGLKPVFDHIKARGMKPGLWISVASASRNSEVYKKHPEWFVKDKNGALADLHDNASKNATACMATGWYDHIKSTILGLIREHGLAYLKLDLSVVTSAYVYDTSVAGCYATDHPLHRDQAESLLVEYRRCMDLFDELHREAPTLFIDCTFETWGALQLIDYALVKHAEGDWLSNIYEPLPLGSLRVRNLAWARTPVLPAGALVIGNLAVDDPQSEAGLLSLAGSLPIMLGDPRKIPDAQRTKLRVWADWMERMEKKHGYFLFRQDLPGFGEPTEGSWDGWARINNDTGSGGMVGVFRQGGGETERTVLVPALSPDRNYTVFRAPNREKLGQFTGRDLAEKGFRVSLPEKYSQALFEISGD
jgi:alpha-galactosidase